MVRKCIIEKKGSKGFNYLFSNESLFCDDSLRLLNYKSFLVSELKRHGYDTIVFFEYKKGLYCIDEESWRGWAEVNILNRSPKERADITANIDVQQQIRSKFHRSNKSTPQEEQKTNTKSHDELVNEMKDKLKNEFTKQEIYHQISAIDSLLYSKNHRVAIIADMELLSINFEGYNEIFNIAIDEWRENHKNENLFIWSFRRGNARRGYGEIENIKRGNALADSRFIKLSDLECLAQNNSKDSPRESTIVEVFAPSVGEIRNYLNHLRLRNLISFKIDEIDEIAKKLHSVSRAKNWLLADLHVEIRKLFNKTITAKNIETEFSFKERKSGEKQLENLIGMDNIKTIVKQIKNQYSCIKKPDNVYVSRLDRNDENSDFRERLHFAIKGNPGTGKTTVAQILGQVLYEIGALSSGHVVKCSASSFNTKYVGETSQMVGRKIEEAMGGVLFIDEIASLDKSGQYTKAEVNGTLLDAMTSYKDLCVIFAGYPDELNNYLKSDPGLTRRFGGQIVELPDYNGEELTKILIKMAESENYVLEDSLVEILPNMFNNMYRSLSKEQRKYWGNAGISENFFIMMKREAAVSNTNVLTKDMLPKTIDCGDYKLIIEKFISRESVEKVKKVANDLNLSKLKSFVSICGVDSERQKEAIIAIKTDEGEGTGFLITPDGYAITCNHVIFKANKITARIRRKLSYGGYFDSEYECAVIKTDPIADIALIKLVNNIENGKSVDNTPFLKLFDKINQEDIAYNSNKTFSLFGYPGGISINDNISYAQGKIMSKRTKESGIDCFWLDVTAIKGNSGSPVIYNDTGEVYGVLCGSDLFTGEHTEEINYMCPVKYIWKLLCDIEN